MAKYKVHKCHRCGGDFKAARFDDIYQMRIMGKLHPVPVKAVPCMYCANCNTHVVGDDADASFVYWRNKYINENGLNKFRHKLWRFGAWLWRQAEWWLFNRVVYRRRDLRKQT